AALGVVLALLVVALAPIVSSIYGDRRLTALLIALASVFVFGGLSTQHRALLRRQLRFRALAACEILALAAGSAAALAWGLHCADYSSLALLYGTREAALMNLVFLVGGWRPGWPRRTPEIRSLVGFGGLMMGFDLIGYFNYKFDNLIVGYALGPVALGFYDKAYQLFWLPINQLSLALAGAAIPLLSRVCFEPWRYRGLLERFVLVSTGLGMPTVAFLFANCDRVIELLFGPTWLPAAPIFRALAPAAFTITITPCVGWIF